MRLQDVLKEREAEIALLEESLHVAESKTHHAPTNIKTNGSVVAPPLLHIESGDGDSEFMTPIEDHTGHGDRSGRSTPVSSSPIPSVNLSPKMMNQFKAIRSSLDPGGLTRSDGDSASSLGQDNLLERLNKLMR